MADDPLGNLKLPYDYSNGDPDAAAPSAPAAPTVQTQAAPPPAPTISHPDLAKIPVPYGQADQPDAPSAKSAPPGPSWTHVLWNSITGEDQPPVVLQPRSLSQVGTDVGNYGRVAGNQAFIPGSLDVGLAALHGTDVAAENAKTKAAESQLGPAAAALARFQGQRASVLRATPWADNPLAQGVVTGGGGTLLQGGSWKDALTNAAADTGLGYAGQALGTGASALAKGAFDRSSKAVSSAASSSLEDLQDLWKRGGDVTNQAETYAKTAATGTAKAAYQKIAEAAAEPIETGWAQRFTAGGIGHFLPGGELASAYIADPAIRAYNNLSKGLNVRSAIDQAYPTVAGAVKTAVDPDARRSALQSLAVSQGPTRPGTFNALGTVSPMSWAKYILPGSQ